MKINTLKGNLKKTVISFLTAILVTTNVAALTTITVSAEESNVENEDISVTNEESPTITVTIMPTESTTEGNKIVTAGEIALNNAQEQAVNNFLEEIGVTSDYVVYADQYGTTTHIDGNIAVNELTTDVEAIKTENVTAGEDTYSYIGDSNGNTVHVLQGDSSDPAILVTGSETNVSNCNGGSTTVDLSEVDVTDAEALAEALEGTGIDSEEFAQEIMITENLESISQSAQELNDQIRANGGELKNEDAVKAVNEMLTNDALQSGDTVVINMDATQFSEGGVQGYIEQLLANNASVGATIIVNLNIGSDATSVEISRPINATAYAAETGWLIWNFGSFAGDVNISQTIAGIIIAPNATVIGNGVVNGRVVADTYIHSMETHQPFVTPTPEVTETPTPEVTETPTPEVTETPTPEVTETPTPEVTETPTPEVTETPTPEVTETPTPEVTETPTPEVTETPTPEVTETPTPEVTETPTPEVTETPTPEITETPTPGDTTTPTPTDTTTPPVVTIIDEETPLAEVPDEGEVLGARRSPVVITEVPDEGEVLGARRAPQTGDSSKANLWTAVLFGATAGMGTWAFLKKKEEKDSVEE